MVNNFCRPLLSGDCLDGSLKTQGVGLACRVRHGKARALLAALLAVGSMGASCPGARPPANLEIGSQTNVKYAEQQVAPNAWAGTNGWYLTAHGQGFAANAPVSLASSNVPGKGQFTFGQVTTDAKGAFVFSTSGGAFTSDRSFWNTDVHLYARQPSTGRFASSEINGGVFVNCLPTFTEPNQLQAFSVSLAIPPWLPGQTFGCPALPPPSPGGGGGGLGGCSAAGLPGCACMAGGLCDHGLVCEYGTTCIPCGGYGQPCCAGGSCNAGFACQFSPAQNTTSCLP